MSSTYSMSVCISGHNRKRTAAIKTAAEKVWDFINWFDSINKTLVSTADGCLRNGDDRRDFAERLAHAIWVANRGTCVVEIIATCIEAPHYTYAINKTWYKQLVKKFGSITKTEK